MQDGNKNNPQQTQALTRQGTPPLALAPSERNLVQLMNAYDSSRYHTLVPRQLSSDLPVGFKFVVTRIDINPDPKSGDVYPLPFGKLGISKNKLNEISNALALRWTVDKRIDDRRSPHYIEWHCECAYVLPDGTPTNETGDKTIDLRSDIGDGTPGADLQEISEVAAKKNRDPSDEIRSQRRNIQPNAQTKAKNRAIRAAAGLKTGYTAEELAKPFLAIKLGVDPHSERGAEAVMAALNPAITGLYGQPKQIMDASFEGAPESDTANLPPGGDGDEAAGDRGGSLHPAASEPRVAAAAGGSEPPDEPPPMPPEEGPAELTAEERDTWLQKIWHRVARAGMQTSVWGKWLKTNTGKAAKDLTREDLEQLEQAAEAYVEANGGAR